MANFSKLLSLIGGAERTVDFSNNANILELGGGGLQMNGSTSGHIVVSASAVTSTYSIVWPAAQAVSSGYVLTNDGTGVLSWSPAAATGVTSVALALPASVFTVSGSPVTSSGTLTGSLNTQSANTIWAGPGTGSPATPTFRGLVSADIPNNAANTTGTASNVTGIVALVNGGTGTAAASANAAFNALSPMTTAGDIIYENATPAAARLPIGSTGNVLTVVAGLPAWVPPSTSGTVTSVALADASSTPIYSISGSPVTSSGTLTQTLITQSANTVFSGPVSGGSSQPSFRALVSNDIPSLSAIYLALAGGTMSGAINLGGFAPTNSTTPVNPNDLVNKSYVDNFINATSWKTSVLVSTTTNITLSGEQTIDGFLTSASRVLVKNQTLSQNNGIYVSASGAWTRALDMDAWAEVPAAAVFVQEGTVNADLGFVCTSQPGGTLGTTPITFVQFSSAGAYSADNVTLQLISGVFSIKNGGVANAQVSATAAIDFSKLAALTSAHILVGNGSAVATDVAVSGDLTLANTGAFTVAKIQTTVVSGTTGSGNVVFSASPTLTGTITAAAANFSGAISASNFSGSSSGTNTGDQIITLTGDVTGSGTGSFVTTIAANAVTTAKINNGAVTAAKLGTVTDGVTTDQNGSGSAIEVLSSPAVKEIMVAGEAFAATTLFAVRFAKAADSGFVAGRVYKADNDTTSADNFYVIGLAYSAGSVSTAGSITATKMGLINVPSHGFTVGAPLFLGTSGSVTATAPSTSLSAVERVGMVRDANNIEVQIQAIAIN